MSVEAIYPSQQQPKEQNPLFARGLRRRRRAFMAILMIIGLGLLLTQIIPMTARADNPARETTASVASAESNAQTTQTQPQKPARKAVRQIPLYNAPLQNQAAVNGQD